MTHSRPMLSAFALALCAGVLPAADTPVALVQLQEPTERNLSADSKDHPGHLFREQTATFDLGDVDYRIAYKACVDPAHGDQVAPLEGYLGMPGPSSCNWYHGGFLAIHLNGRDIGATPLSSMTVVENTGRAIMDMVWRDQAADVRVRIVGLPGRDYLICEVALDPVAEITSVGLKLRCYPSFFTSYHKRDGARRVQTPATLIEQGANETLPADENWWAVYYDEVFDVERGEGEGPCALLLPPGQATEIRLAPGGYSVETALDFPAHTRRIRLAVWDYHGRTNADALASMRAGAEAVRRELDQADFTPEALTTFDVATAREEVQWALGSAPARELLGDTAAEIQEWLTDYAPALEAATAGAGVRAQEDLLRAVSAYDDFRWQIRLSRLLVED